MGKTSGRATTKVITLVNGLKKYSNDIVISTSCSLLHVPYTLENETSLPEEVSQHFAFAKERLQEIKELTELIGTSGSGYEEQAAYLANQQVLQRTGCMKTSTCKHP